MNKLFEDIEKARKPIDEFIEFLEKFDRTKRSYMPILNGINWFLGLSAGALIWFLDDLNRFKIDNSSASKYTVLIIVISFGISTLIFGIIRCMMLLREIAMNTSIDSLQSLPGKFFLGIEKADEKEIEEKREKIKKELDECSELWRKGHNLMIFSEPMLPILKLGFMSFVFGLMLMIFHIIRYILISF